MAACVYDLQQMRKYLTVRSFCALGAKPRRESRKKIYPSNSKHTIYTSLFSTYNMGLTHHRTHVSMINMVNLFFFILEQNIISSFEPFSILKYA